MGNAVKTPHPRLVDCFGAGLLLVKNRSGTMLWTGSGNRLGDP